MKERRKIIFQQYWCQWGTCWWKKKDLVQSIQGDHGNKENQVRMSWSEECFLKSDPKMLCELGNTAQRLAVNRERGHILKASLIKRRGNNLPVTLNCQRKMKILTLPFLSSLQTFSSFCTYYIDISVTFLSFFDVLGVPFLNIYKQTNQNFKCLMVRYSRMGSLNPFCRTFWF